MQAKRVVPGNARAVRRQAAEGACKKYLQLMFVPNIFVQIFYQLLEIALNKANTVYKSYRLAIASSAVILATFAGCATEAPVVAAPAPAPVVQAPVAPVAKPAPVAPPKAAGRRIRKPARALTRSRGLPASPFRMVSTPSSRPI